MLPYAQSGAIRCSTLVDSIIHIYDILYNNQQGIITTLNSWQTLNLVWAIVEKSFYYVSTSVRVSWIRTHNLQIQYLIVLPSVEQHTLD